MKLRIAGLAVLLGLLGHSVEAQTSLSEGEREKLCRLAYQMDVPDGIARYCPTEAVAVTVPAGPRVVPTALSSETARKIALGEMTQEESEVAHPRIRTTGAVMMLFGFGMMLPYGDHFRIFGEDVCVTRYEVDYGTCGPSHMALFVGGVTAMTGIVLIKIGNRKVQVTPTVSRHVAGATATVVW